MLAEIAGILIGICCVHSCLRVQGERAHQVLAVIASAFVTGLGLRCSAGIYDDVLNSVPNCDPRGDIAVMDAALAERQASSTDSFTTYHRDEILPPDTMAKQK